MFLFHSIPFPYPWKFKGLPQVKLLFLRQCKNANQCLFHVNIYFMLPWIFMQLNHWTVYYMTIHYKRQYEAILIDEELTFQGEMFLWRGMRLATYRSRGIMKLWVSSRRCLLSMASCTSVGLLVCTPCRSTMVETCTLLINFFFFFFIMHRSNSLLEVFWPTTALL